MLRSLGGSEMCIRDRGVYIMKKKEKKTVLAKALTSVADGMLSKAANSRCALIYHQPKQPEEVRKFRKNK